MILILADHLGRPVCWCVIQWVWSYSRV